MFLAAKIPSFWHRDKLERVKGARGELAARIFFSCLSRVPHAHIISRMNTVLETRIRAASAEMSKPGRWRVAMEQLEQATSQILASPDIDKSAAQLTLDNMQELYQWTSVMQANELRRLNSAILQLTLALRTD
jgi:hypothetical protein